MAAARRSVVPTISRSEPIMTRASRTESLRAATAALVLVLGAAAPSLAQAPAPAPTPTPTPEATPAPEPEPKVQVGGCVDVYYGYNFNRVDPALRTFDVLHNAFSLSAAEVNFAKVADRREPRRLPHRPVLRQGGGPDRALRAAEGGLDQLARRQGDLQAHPAGLRRACSSAPGAVGRRQVRDADRSRGDRGAGQLELHALDPLRLRDPLLPPGPARHGHRCGRRSPSRATW